MANIIKTAGLGYTRLTGKRNLFEDQKEGREAFERDEAEEVEMRDLIIYAIHDLHTCYLHHVKGDAYKDQRSEDIYTVLRKPDGAGIFTEYEFRNFFWNAVREGEINQKGEINSTFPEKTAIALDFKEGKPINQAQKFRAKIFCKNIRFATEQTMSKIAKSVAVSEQEIADAERYVAKSHAPDSKYRIRFIWVIGHIDIRIA